jgi:hypothetical protein
MVYLTVDTTPVKGYVTIKLTSESGAILKKGTAPVEVYQTGQWIAWVEFGEVSGYTKPADDRIPVFSDRVRTYIYTPVSPPPNGEPPPDGEPPEPTSLLLKILAGALLALSVIGLVVLGVRSNGS